MKRVRHHAIIASCTRYAWLLVICLGCYGPGASILAKQIQDENLNPKPRISPTSIPAGSSYFEFDLESAMPGKAVDQPELVLPVKNPYAVRIETNANIDISGAIKELESLTSGLITGMVYEVTGRADGTTILAEQGIQLAIRHPISPNTACSL